MLNSIQGRLTAYILAGTVVVLLAVGFIIDAQLSKQLENDFNRSLLAKAMTMVTLTEQDSGVVEFDLLEDLAPEFTPGEGAEYVQLMLRDGTLVRKSTSLGETILPYRKTEFDKPWFEDLTLPDGRSGRIVSFSFIPIDDTGVDDEEEIIRHEPVSDGQMAEDEEPTDGDVSGAGDEWSEDDVSSKDDESSEETEDDDESSELDAGADDVEPEGAIKEAVESASGPGQEIIVDLALAQGKEPLTDLLTTMRTRLLLSFLLLLALLTGLVRVSIGAGLKPLRRMAREVEHIGAENLHERVSNEHASRELQPIALRLNNLLSRLEEAFDREKRFSGNVAHELRTPIAELRALAEVGKEWPSERDMVEGFFGDLVDLADDMERTVANLLMLARLDAGTQDIKQESFDLTLLVDGIVDKFSGQIEEKELRFRNDVPRGVEVTTDKDKLKLILINIIYNAITYSPEGSEIGVQATQINSHVELNVSNDTVDLNQSDVSMMFERFWRKEQVRTGSNHAGLGLSLVKALAELLNLKVRPALDAGSRFTLSLSGLNPAT
jgi:signal transduction histidine kinase